MIIGTDGTGSGLCSVANFIIISVEYSVSATTALVLKHFILAKL